jgi:ribulose-phosphate 3-epimerase
MSDHYQISPSILAADFTCLQDQISQVKTLGADWIHFDTMDGHFVPNLTMGPFLVTPFLQISGLPVEVHLMIENPDRYLEAFAQAGASRLIVHVEADPHLHRTLQSIQEMGLEAGVALNPGTPAVVLESILHLVDMVLVMTVNPGYSGQQFIPEMLGKITKIRSMLDDLGRRDVDIEVDGGITSETLPMTLKAGANVFVAATAIFKHPDGIDAGIEALRAQLQS